ncbi:hypothetical protein FISHEDRAFT_38594 [Fistulina hepatica ATCC 64428]|nr:hypothetical protein FISHEDRAFT_38594 [Fistulina hepatica ATCC 64428]
MVSAKDMDRLFLQAVLSRGVVTAKLARILWGKCILAVNNASEDLDLPVNTDDKDAWDGFLIKVNASLNDLDFEFRHFHDQVIDKDVYALVNRKGDEVAQMATDYSAVEIAFFKVVIEQIMLAPREAYSVSSLAALREISSIKPKTNMTKSQGEALLSSFVARKWLVKSK